MLLTTLATTAFAANSLLTRLALENEAIQSLGVSSGALILFGMVQATLIVAGLRRGEAFQPLRWVRLFVAAGGLGYLALPGLTALVGVLDLQAPGELARNLADPPGLRGHGFRECERPVLEGHPQRVLHLALRFDVTLVFKVLPERLRRFEAKRRRAAVRGSHRHGGELVRLD